MWKGFGLAYLLFRSSEVWHMSLMKGNQWLLTNAHVVRHAAVVQVRKRGDHQKFIATVLRHFVHK